MKPLYIIALFLGCSLVWAWVDLCGADLGLGETLPFCIECSGLATTMRLLLLLLTVWSVNKILQFRPDNMQIYDNDAPPGQTFRIHWHRIGLLFALVTYPLWLWWVDVNTIIPGPDALWLTRNSCRYPGVKGTILWGIEMVFVVLGFRLLYRS